MSLTEASKIKAIIVPGNGCDDVRDSVFYDWLAQRIRPLFPGGVILRDFPDPYVARESIWIPFILNELGCDENTVLIGHSSGASAIMRLLENHKVLGAVLISAALTDQGIENERASGYYSRPWQWSAMTKNAKFIIQISSEDDHLVPIDEQRTVAKGLGGDVEYLEFKDMGHFLMSEVPQIAQVIERKMKILE
ncbi:hypothetical protein SpCBS45565_g06353 [Spizellomyces sp. 'palustris']|nr:hypothetical protein SpCBS45565_g06353 [Spizellomyces sp. 'palustris']